MQLSVAVIVLTGKRERERERGERTVILVGNFPT